MKKNSHSSAKVVDQPCRLDGESRVSHDPILAHELPAYTVAVQQVRGNGGMMMEKCGCGNRITPFAKRLQNSNPSMQKKCVACLIREGKVEVVHR